MKRSEILDIQERIYSLRKQILIHRHLAGDQISDDDLQAMCYKLQAVQEEHPDLININFYDEKFKHWDENSFWDLDARGDVFKDMADEHLAQISKTETTVPLIGYEFHLYKPTVSDWHPCFNIGGERLVYMSVNTKLKRIYFSGDDDTETEKTFKSIEVFSAVLGYLLSVPVIDIEVLYKLGFSYFGENRVEVLPKDVLLITGIKDKE